MSHPAKDRVAEADARLGVLDDDAGPVVHRPPRSHRGEGGTSRFVLACYAIGVLAVVFVVAAVLFSLSR
jgi:hypothetical protein